MKTIRHYLVVYDRSTGKTLALHTGDPEWLIEMQTDLDIAHASNPNVEIVLLAGDIDDLMVTHERYFAGLR